MYSSITSYNTLNSPKEQKLTPPIVEDMDALTPCLRRAPPTKLQKAKNYLAFCFSNSLFFFVGSNITKNIAYSTLRFSRSSLTYMNNTLSNLLGYNPNVAEQHVTTAVNAISDELTTKKDYLSRVMKNLPLLCKEMLKHRPYEK